MATVNDDNTFKSKVHQQLCGLMFRGCRPNAIEQCSSWSYAVNSLSSC